MASSFKINGSLIVRVITGVVILVVAVMVVGGLAGLREIPKAEKAKNLSPLVETRRGEVGDKQIEIRLNGTIEALKKSQIVSQVSGQIKSVQPVFVEGGVVDKADQLLLSIDDADYQSALANAKAEESRVDAQIAQLEALKSQAEVNVSNAKLAKAQAEASKAIDKEGVEIAKQALEQAKEAKTQAVAAFQLEENRAKVAIKEWEDYAAANGLDPSKVPDLVARKPQLNDAKARVRSASAGIETAIAGVRSANARLENATKAIDVAEGNIQAALEQVKVSNENIKVAKAQKKSAAIAIETAQRNLDRCEIKAPYSGHLYQRMVHEGQFVSAGQPLVTLVSLERVQAVLPVAKDQVAYLGLQPDENGSIKELDFLLETTIGDYQLFVNAKVKRVSPMVDAKSRAYLLYAEIDNVNDVKVKTDKGLIKAPVSIRPGSFVSVTVKGRLIKDVFEVERSALLDSAPRSIEAKFPNAENFIAYLVLEKPAHVIAAEAKEAELKAAKKSESAKEDSAEDAPAAEEADSEGASEELDWQLAWIEFMPVGVTRKEGQMVLLHDIPEMGTMAGKLIITTPLDVMTHGMEVRVLKSAASNTK